jgi:hypothetical protein
VESATGGYIKNRYDPEGLRFEVYENGNLNRFIFSGRDVVAELDGNDNLKASIVRGHELLAQRDSKGSIHYYLNNAHGDVVGLVDAKGTVVNSYKYECAKQSLAVSVGENLTQEKASHHPVTVDLRPYW